MNDPEIEAITGPAPEYWDLGNAVVALVEWYSLCGNARHGERRISVSDDEFVIEEMEERIRRALASGKMRGYFQEGSEFIELPRIVTETNESRSRVIVKFDEVLEFGLPGEHKPPAAPSATEPGQRPRPAQPIASSAAAIESAPGSRSLPYLDFMNRVAEDLALDGRRIVAKELRHQLEVRWNTDLGAELGPPSNAKLAAMATLLRFPEFEKGGRLPAPSAAATESGQHPRCPPYLDFMNHLPEELPRDGRRLSKTMLRDLLKKALASRAAIAD